MQWKIHVSQWVGEQVISIIFSQIFTLALPMQLVVNGAMCADSFEKFILLGRQNYGHRIPPSFASLFLCCKLSALLSLCCPTMCSSLSATAAPLFKLNSNSGSRNLKSFRCCLQLLYWTHLDIWRLFMFPNLSPFCCSPPFPGDSLAPLSTWHCNWGLGA